MQVDNCAVMRLLYYNCASVGCFLQDVFVLI